MTRPSFGRGVLLWSPVNLVTQVCDSITGWIPAVQYNSGFDSDEITTEAQRSRRDFIHILRALRVEPTLSEVEGW